MYDRRLMKLMYSIKNIQKNNHAPCFVARNVKAATLLETLVAMIIVLIGFSISIMIYINVIKSNSAGLKIKANMAAEAMKRECIRTKSFIDEEKEYDQFVLVKTAEKYDKNERLVVLRIVAKTKKGRKLFDRREMVVEK